MVSTIWMPDTVAAASLPESRSCTRVMFTRLAVISCETSRFSTIVTRPTAVRSTLQRSITTR